MMWCPAKLWSAVPVHSPPGETRSVESFWLPVLLRMIQPITKIANGTAYKSACGFAHGLGEIVHEAFWLLAIGSKRGGLC
jgi:hypothetical protein